MTPLLENTSRYLVPLVLKNLFASGGGQPSLLPEIAENFPLSIDQLEYLQKLKESDPSLIIPPLILHFFPLYVFFKMDAWKKDSSLGRCSSPLLPFF
jgi:hypothetical protein